MPGLIDSLNEALDRYDIERELGQGGMGTVYVGRDRRHDRLVAIKVLRPEWATAIGAGRFLKEVQLTARLQHPHVVPVFDSGQANGHLYYVMPLVEGESLRDRLARESVLGMDEALEIADQVGQALDYAHGAGVIHRDVKPQNILLSGGQAFLADFGVARALSEAGGERITATGQSVGTPAYMSPEQAGGEQKIDGRSDIYALACVLFEMLGGEPPFTGRTPRAVVARHLTERPPSIEVVRPTVPSSVAEAIRRGMAKVPQDRPATAAELLADCRRASPRPRRARFGMRLALASAAVLAAIAIGMQELTSPSSGLGLDGNKVMVFPLATTTAIQEADAGWDVALSIGAALEHTEPLKWIDAWTWLPEELRADPAAVTLAQATELSIGRGARFMITGAVRGDGDTTAVVLRLHDIEGDSLVTQSSAKGAVAEATLPDLGLDAVVGILARLIDPGRDVDLTPLTDRDPAAVALSIQGDREYRQSNFGPAQDFYERALEQDPMLAFAGVKGAQAASWNSRLDQAEVLIDLALERDEVLPDKYREFAHGLKAYIMGAADPAVAAFNRALELDPEWSEAHAALGETYRHLFPSEAPLDSLAERSLRRALALDASFAPPMVHLIEFDVRAGQVERADRLLRRYRAMGPDTVQLRQLSLMLECVRDGPESVDWTTMVAESSQAALQAGSNLAPAGSQPACALAALEAVLASELPIAYRWSALRVTQGLHMARGDYAAVDSLLQGFLAEGVRLTHSLYVFDHLAGAPFEEQAARAEAIATEATGPMLEGLPISTRWLLGWWFDRQGDASRARAVFRAMAADTTGSGDPSADLARFTAAAHLQLLEGDTAAALQALRSLTPEIPRSFLVWRDFEPLPFERMLLAELLLTRGEFEEAYRVATVFDHPGPIMYLPFLPQSLHLRARAAEALGREDLASASRRRLEGLGWPSQPP